MKDAQSGKRDEFYPLLPEAELLDGFLRLINLDLAMRDYSEVINLYFDHLDLLPSIPIPCYSKKPEMVFRAIRCREVPRTVDRLSNPPPSLTPKGRLNIEGHPVFYASDKALISILEMNPRPGDKLYLGNWQVVNFNNVLICPMLVDYCGQVPVLLKQKQLLRDSISKLKPTVRRRFLTVYRLMTEILLGNNYDLSSVIGHFMFNEMAPRTADIIIFPSVKAQRQHANFAFSLRMVKTRFRFMGATYLEVVEIARNQRAGRFLCLRETTQFYGGLAWKNNQPPREFVLYVDASDWHDAIFI